MEHFRSLVAPGPSATTPPTASLSTIYSGPSAILQPSHCDSVIALATSGDMNMASGGGLPVQCIPIANSFPLQDTRAIYRGVQDPPQTSSIFTCGPVEQGWVCTLPSTNVVLFQGHPSSSISPILPVQHSEHGGLQTPWMNPKAGPLTQAARVSATEFLQEPQPTKSEPCIGQIQYPKEPLPTIHYQIQPVATTTHSVFRAQGSPSYTATSPAPTNTTYSPTRPCHHPTPAACSETTASAAGWAVRHLARRHP